MFKHTLPNPHWILWSGHLFGIMVHSTFGESSDVDRQTRQAFPIRRIRSHLNCPMTAYFLFDTPHGPHYSGRSDAFPVSCFTLHKQVDAKSFLEICHMALQYPGAKRGIRYLASLCHNDVSSRFFLVGKAANALETRRGLGRHIRRDKTSIEENDLSLPVQDIASSRS